MTLARHLSDESSISKGLTMISKGNMQISRVREQLEFANVSTHDFFEDSHVDAQTYPEFRQCVAES